MSLVQCFMLMQYLNDLNEAQKEAVTTTDGAVLVIAGAGSGKTRVVEYRVLHLVGAGVDPRSILLLTFTRRAAREMLARAARHDARCAGVEGGTFHSFAYKMLRTHGDVLGLSSTLSILDGSDAEEAVFRAGVELGYFTARGRRSEGRLFPKKGVLHKILSMSRNKGIPVEDILDADYPQFMECLSQLEEVGRVYTRYKREKGYLDYDDLLFYLAELLRDSSIRRALSARYSHIMVDEYQDTNAVQGEIVHLLGKERGNVMIVGDDAQSIYGFRGASHRNIMEFPDRFSDTRIIKLEENYRSTQKILDVANAVLESMKHRYEKKLLSTGEEGKRPPLTIYTNQYEEAARVAARIEVFVRDGVALRDQAVLFRSSYASIPLQTELTKRGVTFQVFGGQKFYEAAHVKDVIAHLRVVSNVRDELSWQRLLLLIEGVGLVTADAIMGCIMQSPSAVVDVLRSRKDMEELATLMRDLHAPKISVGEQFKCVVKYYTPILKANFDNWYQRVRDLEVVSDMAGRYKTLQEFLADFTIEPPQNVKDAGRSYGGSPSTGFARTGEEDDDVLTLSTIHSAKGLEWEVVFFIGLSEGVLPSKFALEDEDQIEEEHRLFYVGVTRAKRHLFLSLSSSLSRFGGGHAEMSRFLMAPGVLDTLDYDQSVMSDFVSDDGDEEKSFSYDDDDDDALGGALAVW